MTGRSSRTQVNIRLEPHDADVLAAVAFLNDASGAEVLRPVVQAFLGQLRDNPEVKAALDIRARQQRAPKVD